MIKDHVPGSATTFERNPDYWGYDERHPENRLPYVDTLKVLVIPDKSTLYAAFRTGKLDWLPRVETRDGESLLRINPKILSRMVITDTATMYKMRVDMAPFTDVRVRRAMNMAIDREEIVKTFYRGYALPKASVIGPAAVGSFTPYGGYAPDVNEVLTYNPAKAKQLLAEAGYPDGFKTHIDYAEPTAWAPAGATEIFQSYLAKIGIEAELRPRDAASLIELWSGRKHTAIVLHQATNWPQSALNLQRFSNPAMIYNLSSVNDPVLTQMYNDAMTTLDPVEYDKKIKEIDTYIVKQAYAIFWPHSEQMLLWQPWVKGYNGEGPLNAPGPSTLYARIWVDQDLKEQMTGTR